MLAVVHWPLHGPGTYRGRLRIGGKSAGKRKGRSLRCPVRFQNKSGCGIHIVRLERGKWSDRLPSTVYPERKQLQQPGLQYY